jgi:hypothetical protein
LRPEIFDVIFSYSVLQHFSEENVRRTLSQIHEALRGGGRSKIQMAAKYGVRSLYHQLKQRSEAPKSFDVRYWSPSQLKQTFERYIGPTELEVDCYFGLGLQPTDTDMMSPLARWATQSSEKLRVLSQSFTPLKRVADSLYLNSRKMHPETDILILGDVSAVPLDDVLRWNDCRPASELCTTKVDFLTCKEGCVHVSG